MSQTIEALSNASPRARALETLRRWLDDGVLAAGTAIPPERELCRKLGVSLATLHRATKALEVEGRLKALGGRTRVVVARPEGQAKLLRNTIAVFAPSRKPLPLHTTPGWSEYVSVAAFDAIESAGYHALAVHSERRSEEDMQDLLVARPLGAIVPEVASRKNLPHELLAQLREAGVGVTVFGDSPDVRTYDRVVSDHAIGAAEITAWMIAKGRRRILQMLPFQSDAYWVRMRRQGYEQAMRDAGLEPLPALDVVPMKLADEMNAQATRATFEAKVAYDVGCLMPRLQQDPTIDALLLPSDGNVPVTAAALRRLGREPNRDILLAGYDNYFSDIWEQQFDSAGPLVTADRDNPKLGGELVQLLIDRLEGRLPAEPVCRRVQPRLIELPAK